MLLMEVWHLCEGLTLKGSSLEVSNNVNYDLGTQVIRTIQQQRVRSSQIKQTQCEECPRIIMDVDKLFEEFHVTSQR